MPSVILAPSNLAGNSSDVTVTAGSTNTVAIYMGGTVDNLKLPNGIDNFLLPAGGGGGFLLLSPQDSDVLTTKDYALIQLKDPTGAYFDSGLSLRHNARFKTLGPGVWRLAKPITLAEFGLQSE